MTNCLTPLELQDLLADKLPPPEADRARAHLGVCPKCRQQLGARQAENQLFGELREACRDDTAPMTGGPRAAPRHELTGLSE